MKGEHKSQKTNPELYLCDILLDISLDIYYISSVKELDIEQILFLDVQTRKFEYQKNYTSNVKNVKIYTTFLTFKL